MLPSYDPYLTSGHYDYPPSDLAASAPVYHYYPQEQEPASDVLVTDTMAASATTEDITFAEAFSALANFDPALPPDHNVDEVRRAIENNICKYSENNG